MKITQCSRTFPKVEELEEGTIFKLGSQLYICLAIGGLDMTTTKCFCLNDMITEDIPDGTQVNEIIEENNIEILIH